jgi:hypothetical protein
LAPLPCRRQAPRASLLLSKTRGSSANYVPPAVGTTIHDSNYRDCWHGTARNTPPCREMSVLRVEERVGPFALDKEEFEVWLINGAEHKCDARIDVVGRLNECTP